MTGEAPRGEGRRGANERLWLGGWGSAPVRRLNKRGAGLFRCLGLFSARRRAWLKQGLVKDAARVRVLRHGRGCCSGFDGLRSATDHAIGADPVSRGYASPGPNPFGEARGKGHVSMLRQGSARWLVTVWHSMPSSTFVLVANLSYDVSFEQQETTGLFCYEIWYWRSFIGIDIEDERTYSQNFGSVGRGEPGKFYTLFRQKQEALGRYD